MSGRYSKRGKNPGIVDSWLDSLGFYRKNIAYDETCLFRAASEQLFFTQINHEDIRRRIIEYAVDNYSEFKTLVSSKREWNDRLKRLSVHMVICSDIEIRLISKSFKIDIVVFDASKRQSEEFIYDKNKPSKSTIKICKLGQDHYDAIYDKDHIVNTGFCQSIVYSILYENVFLLANVSSTVNSMLHDKDGSLCMYYTEDQNNDEIIPSDQSIVLAPFPFKVAKALDPNMYRNIEYDSWLETRREFRLGEWYYGDDNLILGTRCIINIGSEQHQCYIQEFLSHRRCIVFVTKLAQRLTVGYDQLRREDDAKPWPLPYRFSRNSFSLAQTETADSTNSKGFRKQRNKKQLEINTHFEENEPNTFQGCPLVKQETNDGWLLPRPKLSLHIPSKRNIGTCEDWGNVPEEPSCPVDQPPTESDFYMNLPENTTSPTDNYEGNPNDTHPQVVYAYNQEFSYPPMPVWSNPPYAISPDAGIHLNDTDVPPTIDNTSPQKYVYYTTDSAYSSPVVITPTAPINYSYSERSHCSTPISAPPRFDVYPFVYSPVHLPTAPVFYPPPPALPPSSYTPVISPLPTITSQRSQDHATSPFPFYASPYEIHYYNTPSPYSPWAYPHVNHPQGFIFPAPQ